jgi:hypothetical protein
MLDLGWTVRDPDPTKENKAVNLLDFRLHIVVTIISINRICI